MASGFAFVALFMTSWLKGVDRERLTPEQRGDAGTAVSRLRVLMDSPLALYALASLALNLSFAQVEASLFWCCVTISALVPSRLAGCSPISVSASLSFRQC